MIIALCKVSLLMNLIFISLVPKLSNMSGIKKISHEATKKISLKYRFVPLCELFVLLEYGTAELRDKDFL